MKIAWFGWSIEKGGDSFHDAGYLIVKNILKKGHTVHYFGYHPYQVLPNDLTNYPNFRMSALTVSKITRRILARCPQFLFLALESLVMFLKQFVFYFRFRIIQSKEKFDVIFFWGQPETFPFLPQWFGVPVIIHLQGHTLGEIRAFMIDRELILKLEGPIRFYYLLILMWLKVIIQKIGIKNASIIISPSRLVSREIIDAYKINPQLVKTVPYPVNLESFTPSLKKKKRDNYVLLYAGRLSYRKGVDTLIKALIGVKGRVPNILLEIAGAPWGAVTERFAHLINEPALKDYIVLHGWVKHNEMAGLIQQADVVVVPSKYEPFGMIVAESLACGIPIILSDKVGSKDIVTEESSIIFRSDSSLELAKAILKMRKRKNGPDLPSLIRKLAEDRLNVNCITDQILEILSDAS